MGVKQRGKAKHVFPADAVILLRQILGHAAHFHHAVANSLIKIVARAGVHLGKARKCSGRDV